MTWIAAATIGSSLIGAYSANKAADAQSAAAQRDAEMRMAMFNKTNEQMQPYRTSGYEALDTIRQMQPYLNKKYSAEDFQADPSYQFRLNQGNVATQNLGNQAGGVIGGNTLKAMMDYNSGAASTEFGNAFNRNQTEKTNIFNRLTNIAGLGAGVVNAGAAASNSAAEGIGQAYTNEGAANASRYIGASNAITGGANTYAKYNYLSSLLDPSGGAPTPTDMTGFKSNSSTPWVGSSATSPQPFQFLPS
jgi:hypothetical protein